MSFCGLTKGVSLKICRLCVRVKINKLSFNPFCVWISSVSMCNALSQNIVSQLVVTEHTLGIVQLSLTASRLSWVCLWNSITRKQTAVMEAKQRFNEMHNGVRFVQVMNNTQQHTALNQMSLHGHVRRWPQNWLHAHTGLCQVTITVRRLETLVCYLDLFHSPKWKVVQSRPTEHETSESNEGSGNNAKSISVPV